MKYQPVIRFLALALTGALVACGDPKSANKGNFTTAIDAILKTENPLCYIVSTQAFPLVIRKDGQFAYGSSLPQLNALVKAGVLSAKDSQKSKNYEGIGGAENPNVAAIEFSVTPSGQTAYKEKMEPNEKWPQGGAGFCLGSAEVSKIVDFTEPTVEQGGTISQIQYIYKVKTAESWAQTPEIKKTFPDFAKAEEEGLPGKIKLERGVKGWRESRFNPAH